MSMTVMSFPDFCSTLYNVAKNKGAPDNFIDILGGHIKYVMKVFNDSQVRPDEDVSRTASMQKESLYHLLRNFMFINQEQLKQDEDATANWYIPCHNMFKYTSVGAYYASSTPKTTISNVEEESEDVK